MQKAGVISLAGEWMLSDTIGEYRTPMQLPGDIISGLHAAGLIPDPYFGRNEYDLRWIADRDWLLSRDVEAEAGDYELVLSQIDTVAEVRLNGTVILEAANAFRRWRVPCRLKDGANNFEILLKSPTAAANNIQAAQPYFVPYTQNYPVPNGNMLRKPQCDFGWDWNAALMPSGVYGDMRLEPVVPVRIADVLVSQRLEGGAAVVKVQVEVVGSDASSAEDYRLELCGQVIVGTANLHAGSNLISETFHIEDPKLWWPAGQGSQPLHDLNVQVGGASAHRKIGLRAIDLVSEPDDIGRSLKVRVNGRDIFCKGANWIPADALAGRVTKEDTRDLLQSAVNANMNMIRIWGGGWYEPDWFYDICDELGLLVWQDAMFSCSLYPATEAFLAEVDQEIEDVAKRLQHRTCIALWCGDNELIGALTWYKESVEDRDRYLVAYDRLNRTIETALKRVDPEVNWWPSSPSPGPLSFGDAWHDDSAGDMHFWSVWHEGRDFDHYRDVTPRFCSEFGFQSYPSLDVIRKFANASDMNIASRVMESHQKNDGGNARIAETMFRYFRFPEGFENFVYLSQIQQGEAIKTAVNYWRSQKPACMGALYWQLNDTWPVASWASLDHGGGWKLMHYMAREFFAPVSVCAYPVDDQIMVRAVSDESEDQTLNVKLHALSLSGQRRALSQHTSVVTSNQALPVTTLAASDLETDEVLLIEFAAGEFVGQEIYTPKPFKDFDLVAPNLSMDVQPRDDHWEITLKSEHPAFFVSVESDKAGRYSDNARHVLPGRPVSLTFKPKDAGTTPQFTLRDLYSATYA